MLLVFGNLQVKTVYLCYYAVVCDVYTFKFGFCFVAVYGIECVYLPIIE